MIIINYNGGLGNRLFQYTFARMAAEKLGSELKALPIKGFPGTCEVIKGKRVEQPEIILECKEEKPLTLKKVYDSWPAKIILNGFFQDFNKYSFDKEKIRKFLEIPSYKKNPSITAQDLVMHLRLGDYVKLGLALNADYYKLLIERIKFNNLYIVTNQPNDPFLDNFKQYQPTIVTNTNELKDFCYIKQFSKIICSASTFSWWAAYLAGEATEIYWPLPNRGLQNSYLLGLRLDIPEFITVYNVSEWQRDDYNLLQRFGNWFRKFMSKSKIDPWQYALAEAKSVDVNLKSMLSGVLEFHKNSKYLIMEKLK